MTAHERRLDMIFTGWIGDVSSANNPETVSMDADKVVTATFAAIPTYNLTVNVSPDGSGSVTVDPDASEYDTGTVVTMTSNERLWI